VKSFKPEDFSGIRFSQKEQVYVYIPAHSEREKKGRTHAATKDVHSSCGTWKIIQCKVAACICFMPYNNDIAHGHYIYARDIKDVRKLFGKKVLWRQTLY
jgi:hypothetical protein